ncbi:Ankyrin-2 [Toensbergia leucococca]|nr:Ankyrin-2 [Toensbergia leucococca]
MDPLSLTASIIAIVGVSAQSVKVLRRLISLGDAPLLASALNNELSDLRLNVLAVQELFTKHSSGSEDPALDQNAIISVVACLKRANTLVVELDCLLSPLLVLLSRPDNAMPKKWIAWMKVESRLKRFVQDLYNVRVALNTALGILDLNTSIRLETTVHALRQYIAEIQDDQARMKEIHGQHVVKMEIFMELITKTIVSHPEMTSERDQNDGTLNAGWDQKTNEPWGTNSVAIPMNSVHVADIEPRYHCSGSLLLEGTERCVTSSYMQELIHFWWTIEIAVNIAWEAVLANNKVAKNLQNLLALSSREDYMRQCELKLLHRSVLGLNSINLHFLLEEIPSHTIDEKDADGQTALFWAAIRADSQAVSLLLGAGADFNSQNNHGVRILTAAIMSNDTCCVQKILTSGADINYVQADGYTPLHHSCRYGVDVEILKALLDRGANTNARTRLGHTPLMIATFNMRTATAKVLIDRGVDLDIQGKDGGSALHYAVMTGNHDTVIHLLEKKANHRLKTKSGETILHFLAQRNGDLQLIQSLESFDLEDIDVEATDQAQKRTALQVAELHHRCDFDWLESFKALIEKISVKRFGPGSLSPEYVDASEYFF